MTKFTRYTSAIRECADALLLIASALECGYVVDVADLERLCDKIKEVVVDGNTSE